MMNQDDVVELYQEEELKSAMTQRQGACFIEGSPKSKVFINIVTATNVTWKCLELRQKCRCYIKWQPHLALHLPT